MSSKRPDLKAAKTKETMVDLLISASDPEGENYARLVEIRHLLEERVVLSFTEEAYLSHLAETFEGSRECQHFRRIGPKCSLGHGRQCVYNGDWRSARNECLEYDVGKLTPKQRREPIPW